MDITIKTLQEDVNEKKVNKIRGADSNIVREGVKFQSGWADWIEQYTYFYIHILEKTFSVVGGGYSVSPR